MNGLDAEIVEKNMKPMARDTSLISLLAESDPEDEEEAAVTRRS